MNAITYEERAKIYARAAETFGRETQTIVAIEELSELIQALCKDNRGQVQRVNLAEEIADVTIMLEQMRILYGINPIVCATMDYKVRRLAERIEEVTP